ncbi:hypothetical protein [Bradyrhizobium sp.]|uniref:hypothetical protein n=1 Tax=Bradyrhizobium sp. TaxID=376 RepID=UPI0025C05BF5|nr:hypothetical protein [Bradyrhizobium sp.]
MRRDFGSRAAKMCAWDDVFEAVMLIQSLLQGMIARGEALPAHRPINDQET